MTIQGKGFGAGQYVLGGKERMADARVLLDAGQFAGSIYLSGRGVEAMLRALLWTHDPDVRTGRKSLDTGHDFRQLLSRVRDLGLLTHNWDEQLRARVHRVARLWFNNMRFVSSGAVQAHWIRLGTVGRRHTMKLAAREFLDDCASVVEQCEALCRK